MFEQQAVYFNEGNKYYHKKNYDKALSYYKKQNEIIATKESWLNMGNTYKMMNKLNIAKECYIKAADISVPYFNGKHGEYVFALSNLGLLYFAMGDNDTAIKYYEKALSIDPEHGDSGWNLSLALLRKLCSGEDVDPDVAWDYYDWRFKRSDPVRINSGVPVWDGKSKGRSIVVLAEQGFGDKIMWGRYFYRLKEYFDEVWLQLPDELFPLFTEFNVCNDPYVVGAEVSIPTCKLAHIFGITSDNAEYLKGKFGTRDFGSGPNVLIEWAGNKNHANNFNRVCPIGYFKSLGIKNLYNCNPANKEMPGIKKLKVNNWKDTAEIVNGMDLVISVDTSLVHVAGALGKECWMLQPRNDTDFRWGSYGEDNLWYPSVKIIRNPNDWEKVFEVVKAKLDAKNFTK